MVSGLIAVVKVGVSWSGFGLDDSHLPENVVVPSKELVINYLILV
jgi:hypothetical protein